MGRIAFETAHVEASQKESAEPRHCSRDADQGARRNSARPAPFRVRPSNCFLQIQERFRSGWSFLLKQHLTHESLQIVAAATLSGHGLRSVRSPGLEFVGSATCRSSSASLSSQYPACQHRCQQIADMKVSVLYVRAPCGSILNRRRRAILWLR